MNNNLFEKNIIPQESLSKEELVSKLEIVEEKYIQLLAAEKKSEFYDKELCDSFLALKRNLGPTTPEILELYIGSAGGNYPEMLANYNKQREFESTVLKPVRDEMFAIESEINKIDRQELENNKALERKKAQEKFQIDKDEVEVSLYEALNKIHLEIPQEAHEVGMKTDVALKTYKPELVEVANQLEWYIGRLNEVIMPRQLDDFKERLKRDRLVNLE
jgi:hypothetical protein